MTWEYFDWEFVTWTVKLIQTSSYIGNDLIWEYIVVRTREESSIVDKGSFMGNGDSAPTIERIMEEFLSHMTNIALKITESA